MRLFVAVPLPEVLRPGLMDCLRQWRKGWPKGKWVPPESWHVTLRFLGEVPEEELPVVKAWLRTNLVEAKGGRFQLGKPGFFHRRGRYVLWAGLAEVGWMNQLGERLGGPVDHVLPERREFSAHLTLLRAEISPRDELRFQQFLSKFQETMLPAEGEMINELILYQTEMTANGARYEVVERMGLG